MFPFPMELLSLQANVERIITPWNRAQAQDLLRKIVCTFKPLRKLRQWGTGRDDSLVCECMHRFFENKLTNSHAIQYTFLRWHPRFDNLHPADRTRCSRLCFCWRYFFLPFITSRSRWHPTSVLLRMRR